MSIPSWINIEGGSGIGNGIISVTAKANSGDARSSIINVTGGG